MNLPRLPLFFLLLLHLVILPARAAEPTPVELKGVGIEEHRGALIPTDVTLLDESGRPVTLAQLLKPGKPVLLNLTYFTCPMLCTMVLNGLVKGLTGVDWTPGESFTILSVSIDPRDKPEPAAEKKKNYLRAYGRAEAARGWHFLTGDQAQVRRLADAVGFHYAWDARQQQYAHAAGLIILTPEGRVSRYLYGMTFAPQDLRLGLLEASQGQIGGPVDRLLLFCYHYDPVSKKYAVFARNLMRLAGGLTVVVLGLLLLVLWRRERKTA